MANPVFSAGGGGFGKFEPFLGRVRSCNQNCKVFLADYTCFIFKFVVFKGKEFTFTELMALKKRSTRNSWSITLHFTKVLLSNLALGWGIWTKFWPEGVGGSRNLMFKWPGGLPKGGFWSFKLIDALIPDVGLSTTLLYAADCKYVLCMTLLAALLN